MIPTILITGGAGYIGSITSLFMAQKGYKIIIIDTQKISYDWAISVQGDFSNKDLLNEIFTQYNIQAVMHFAAYNENEESINNILKIYDNNFCKTVNLLEVMHDYKINKFIFSSSSVVYGITESLPITEHHDKKPITAFGKCKLMIENLLQDLGNASNFKFVSLRYFNVAGAVPEFNFGKQLKFENNLISTLINCAITGMPFTIFGNDYKTKDGTCIRDYVHPWDVANANYKALCYLNDEKPSEFFNVSSGIGYSVKELISAVENICKTQIKIIVSEKRIGDNSIIIGDPIKTEMLLDFKPQCSDLETILRSTYLYKNK